MKYVHFISCTLIRGPRVDKILHKSHLRSSSKRVACRPKSATPRSTDRHGTVDHKRHNAGARMGPTTTGARVRMRGALWCSTSNAPMRRLPRSPSPSPLEQATGIGQNSEPAIAARKEYGSVAREDSEGWEERGRAHGVFARKQTKPLRARTASPGLCESTQGNIAVLLLDVSARRVGCAF